MSAVTAKIAVLAVARTGNVDAAKFLIEKGPPVRSALPGDRGADVRVLTTGATPLHTATTRGWTKVMKELVSYNVDINARDADGLTALDYAMARVRIGFLQQKPPARNDLAKLLKDLGANVENPNLPPWPSVPTPTITAQVPND